VETEQEIIEPVNPETIVVPGAFEARQARLDAIADMAEGERVKGGEFEADETPVVAEEPGGDEPGEEPTHELPQKHKLKVNGEEMELTTEELVATAQKVISADKYLEDAKKSFRVATEVRPSPVDVEPQGPNDDDRALARALQMGDEEEAAKAIHALRPRPSPDVVAAVDNRIALRQQFQAVEADHKDLLGHKALGPIFRQRLTDLAREQPDLSLEDGYRTVAVALRQDFGQMLKPTTPKLERKAAAQQVPAAGGRQPSPPDDDAEVPVSEEIRKTAEANHRRFYGR
jgi:hypothetical protein